MKPHLTPDPDKFLTDEETESFKKIAKQAGRTPTEHLKALIKADLESAPLSNHDSPQ